MTLIVLPSSSVAQNPCRIGYDNLLEQGTVVASSEDAAYPVANLFDWLTCDFFRPAAAGTTYVTLTLTAGASANYLAFYNQDLWKAGGSIGLQYFDGTAWQDVTPGVTPADNAPRMVFFDAVTAAQWRLVITSPAAIPSIGIVSFGGYLALPFGMYMGWSPPRLARASKLTTSMSDSGAFLGRSVLATGIRTALQVQFAADTWMDANWLPFVRHAEQHPFFFAPNIVKRPNDCTLCWTDDDIPPPAHTQYGFMGATLTIRGVVE